MAADRSSGGPLVGYTLAAPPTWGILPPEPVDGPDPGPARQAVAALAADLTTDASAASRCEQLLLLAQPALVAEPRLAVAVWVPDPLRGDPSGLLAVTLLVDEEAGTAEPATYLAALADRPAEREVRPREVERTRLPAGEAVIVSALTADEAGRLEETLTYVVFPDGCRDAVELAFATTELHLTDVLVDDAVAIADSLAVTAGPA